MEELRSRVVAEETFRANASASVDEPEVVRTRVCIVGSGIAAQTAAMFVGQAELKPLMVEGGLDGTYGTPQMGQLMTTSFVDNFPGEADATLGSAIMGHCAEQAKRFGTEMLTQEQVLKVDFSTSPLKMKLYYKIVEADSIIIATGGIPRRLSFPGAEQFFTWGIWNYASYVAHAFFDKTVAVIGGGDAAMEAANYCTEYSPKVYLIHRSDKFRASKTMQNKVLKNPKIEILWNSEVVKAYGGEGRDKIILAGVKVKSVVTGEITDLELEGLFYAIGHVPATEFLKGQLDLDSEGYIVTKNGTTETSVRGVFAAGTVQEKIYKKAVTAAASGCIAAMDAIKLLNENGVQEGKENSLFMSSF